MTYRSCLITSSSIQRRPASHMTAALLMRNVGMCVYDPRQTQQQAFKHCCAS